MDNRLENFEKMLMEVEETLSDISFKMDKLKAEGKVKPATYRQLMGNRHTYQTMMTLYEKYKLVGEESVE